MFYAAQPSTIGDRAIPRSAGFTVIELVLAIMVTCVLAALIVSGFRTHSVRTQVVSGMQLASPWRLMVEGRFRHTGHVPSSWEDLTAGPVSIGSIYVETAELVDGRIDIVYGNDAAAELSGRRLSLTPYETVGQDIVWICGNDIPGLGLEPLGFASGGQRPVQIPTTIPGRYLPAACR